MKNTKDVGFPVLDTEEPDLVTRPMALHELPRQFRIDQEMATIARHHDRIEKAIRIFWGHRDCVEYLQKLILSGTDSTGNSRMGFRPDVVSALMNLLTLHEVKADAVP